MKQNKKSVIILSSFLICAMGSTNAALWAQNIELPEVTTVISGETEKAGADALPEFSDVLKLPTGSGDVQPVLPEEDSAENTDIAAGKTKPVEKSVYAEGLIGGGYPGVFTGNISVARTIGASPFKFSFEHDSATGYAKHSLTDGFSDKTTKLSIEKQYKKNQFEWGASGFYKSAENGLQGQLSNYGAGLMNQDFYNAAGNVTYSFDNGFSVGAAAGADFYNRYADIECTQINTVTYFTLAPSLLFRWEGYGFDAGFTTDYDYDTELSDNILFPKSHRAKFMLDLQWENDILKLYGNAAAVVGKNIMDESVIVPFTVGVEASFPVYFANRSLSLCAEGGIDSYKPKNYDLEEQFKFTNLDWNTSEVSEWYGKFNLSLPLKESFTGIAGVEYRQTAYGNGRWQPDFEAGTPVYSYYVQDFQVLSTKFGLSYHKGIFGISGSWHSNWMDVDADENAQTVAIDVNIQDENSKWGADVNVTLPINDEMETPIVNAEGFIRVTQSVRGVLNISDLIKLYKGETRTYAGIYEGRGGSASLLLKFVF